MLPSLTKGVARRATLIRGSVVFGKRLFQTKTYVMKDYPVKKSESDWQTILTAEQYEILRQKSTERPFSNEKIAPEGAEGVFACVGCDNPLYTTKTKFQSGCGWPSFYEAIPGAIDLHEDTSMGMTRTEMVCGNCGGHLGHVFKGEGFGTPTDERHCVNGKILKFKQNL
jgi:peptide-methionine (R)-S-oxide reductase